MFYNPFTRYFLSFILKDFLFTILTIQFIYFHCLANHFIHLADIHLHLAGVDTHLADVHTYLAGLDTHLADIHLQRQ